jgi:uncharacterized protein with beta-barrel porin domain
LAYQNTGVWRLVITAGVNGGPPQPFIFDTGSPGFLGYFPGLTATGPAFFNCYGSLSNPTCYGGKVAQVSTVSFYPSGTTSSSAAPTATLSTIPAGSTVALPNSGYAINALSSPQSFGANLQGIFGAGNFAGSGTTGSSIIAQSIIPNVYHQGYVVSANGQPNPGGAANPPNSRNSIVTVGGAQQQVNPTCIACVTVGLTPALMGQFGPASNLVPVAQGPSFPNPYGGSVTPNPGSLEHNAQFIVTLPGITQTYRSLLDTGTWDYWLGNGFQSIGTGLNSTITISGIAASGGAVLPTVTSTITGTAANYDAYSLTYQSGPANTIGIPFFMQNSVMFDLTGLTIGYTPFFVTAANLATTANGPLIVGSGNVPLGLAGVISGPGGVTINSGGMAQLSAINTYTGPTTVNAGGAMLISGIGSIASSSGVTNNGTFDVSGAWAPVTIQSLTGSGQVNLGGQNLTLSNASGTFSGTMSDGGFYGGAGGSLTLAGGNFTFAGTGTYTGGTVVSGGNFTLSGSLIGSLAILPAGSFTIVPGGIVNNSGGTTLNLGQLTNGGTLTSNLFNAGSTSNTGTINGSVMNTGTLVNNGTVNGFTYNAGMLGGSGLMAGSVLNTGVISPGNSIGTLSIASNYVHAPSATYLAETNGSGQSDLINVGGQAVLQGGTVFVYAQPGTTYKPTQTYKILNAVGGLSGTFSAVNELYPFLLSSLSYDANNAYLTLQIGGFAAAAVNPIQYAVGTVLDANVSNATGDFAQVLSAMATNIVTDQAAQSVLQQLSGNNYAGLSSSMVQGAQLFMNNFAGQTGGTASLGGSRVAIAEACDVACDPNALPQWGAWGGGIGGFGTIGAQQPVGGVTYNAGGFAAGLDRMITPATRLGVTAGYTSGTQWVSGFAGQSKSDTFNVGLYGNYAQDKVYADALVGYAYSGNQMWRPISIPGLQPRTALGQTGANQFYGQLESGYRFDLGTVANAFVTPFARLQAYTGTQNAFTETGAQSLNLSIAQQTTNSLRSVLGAQLGGAMDLGWREKLAMQFRLGWSHEYADVGRPVTATLAGAPAMPFTTWGVSPQRDGVVLGLSASTAIADATSVYLRYEGNIAGQDSAQAITAGVRMTW